MPPTTDARLARHAADQAGRALLALRAEMTAAGAAPQELKDAGDRRSQEVLQALLARERPGDAVLSEEAPDDPRRLQLRRVWVVDPLDGTREFAEAGGTEGPGRTDWAVHVALWEDGDLVAGAVAVPAAGLTCATDEPPVLPGRAGGPLRLAVSRSRPPSFVRALAEHLDAELVPMGSAGVKALSVVRGQTDAYVHAGGQFEWDSAAPVAVARAAGLRTSRLDGSPLLYNRRDPLLPDLVVARPEVAGDVLAAVAHLLAATHAASSPSPDATPDAPAEAAR